MGTIDTLLRIKADASGAVRGLAPLQASLTETAAAADKTEAALAGLDGQHKITLNDQAIVAAKAEIDRLRASIRDQLVIDPQADTRDAQRRIAQLQRSIRALDAETPVVEVAVEADTTGLDDLKGQVAGLAAGGAGIFGAWKLTGLAADVETTQIALSSLTGSVEQGAQAFSDLQKFAATTPFELDQVTQSARSLLAAGVDAGALPEMLTDLGNAASAVGAPLEEVALVFQQMLTKGKVSNEELLQLAERGVPAYQALADAMGVSVAQIQQMATLGALGADKVQVLSKALGGMFPTSMADQAASLNGQLSTLHDNVVQIGGSLGLIFLPAAKDLTGSLNGLLGSVASVAGAFKDLPGPIKDTVGNFLVLTGIVSSAAFFGPKILAALVAAKALITGTGDAALLASGKLKLLAGSLVVAAGITGLGALSGALQKKFHTHLDTTNLNRELLTLANTGEVTGGMLDSLHANLSGLRGDFSTLGSTAQKVGQVLVGWIPGVTTPLEDARHNVQALDTEMAALVDAGNFQQATTLWQLFVDKGVAAGDSIDEIKAKFPQFADALEAAATAQDTGTDSMDNYIDRLKALNDRIEETTGRFDRLSEAFTSVNDEVVSSQSAVYDYQGAIDALAETLVDNKTFAPDKEAGRANWGNLVALAQSASDQVKATWQTDGRAAAEAQQKAFRRSMAAMLIDAGHTPKRAWQLVNEVMKEPHKINLELGDIDLSKLRAQRTRLLKKKADLVLPITTALTPRAADQAAIDVRKQLKPIDVKLHTVNEGIDEAKELLGKTANPKKKRVAKIGTEVETETAAQALDNFIHTDRPHIKLVADVTIANVKVGDTNLTIPELVPKSQAIVPVPPVGPGLRAAATALGAPAPAAAYFGPRALAGIVPTAPAATGTQAVRLAPRQTPVAVYLDGVEIAHRIEARRAMAATTSVRRTA